jgi:hypothetical protein
MYILGLFLAIIIMSGISVLGATALFEAVVKRRVDGAWDK